PHLSPGAIVTDTASTKARVLEWASEVLPESVEFVGGHPMAGTETPGVEGAQSGLFAGATYALIPLARTAPKAVETVVNMVQILGAKPFFLDPQEHDSLVAAVSHLPIALSIALMRTVSSSPSWREMARLAAGSFRDVSRLASSSPAMHADIFTTNPDAILLWIDRFQEGLGALRARIQAGGPELRAALDEAYDARDAWLRGRVGLDETAKQYSDVPRASEALLGVFAGQRLAQIGRKFDEAERNRKKGGR
ncbi:MAG: prephenate dehydrogenase, partial [Chloroflexi bacterium]|nr:prephenate dehydrogenase [Chloroflexota bacterium]